MMVGGCWIVLLCFWNWWLFCLLEIKLVDLFYIFFLIFYKIFICVKELYIYFIYGYRIGIWGGIEEF